MEALAAPTDEQKPPTGHWLHTLEPGAALNVPTPHGVHVAAAGCGLCEPIGQSKHSGSPSISLTFANVPGVQVAKSLMLAPSGQKSPGSH